MPSNETEKTKSGHKNIAVVVIVSVITFLCLIAVFTRSVTATLLVNDLTYKLEVVSDEAAREKGLGDRTSMPQNRGMLFDYDTDGRRCFWMKDMRFSLDIIWVNSVHRVTHIEQVLSPTTYPKQYCADARYVIELNAGQATAAKLHTGQSLQF